VTFVRRGHVPVNCAAAAAAAAAVVTMDDC
jgi:hypothetical protein